MYHIDEAGKNLFNLTVLEIIIIITSRVKFEPGQNLYTRLGTIQINHSPLPVRLPWPKGRDLHLVL